MSQRLEWDTLCYRYMHWKRLLWITWFVNNNLGDCDDTKGRVECNCKPGWSGSTCATISCDRWNDCGSHGKILYFNR